MATDAVPRLYCTNRVGTFFTAQTYPGVILDTNQLAPKQATEIDMSDQEWEDRAAEPTELYAIDSKEATGTEKSKVLQEFVGEYLYSKQTSMNDSLLHVFDKGKGVIVGIWGFHRLDKALLEIPAQTKVKIQYTGEVELPDSGRKMKTIKLLVPKGTPRVARSAVSF